MLKLCPKVIEGFGAAREGVFRRSHLASASFITSAQPQGDSSA